MNTKQPDQVDVEVGQRVRARRHLLGLSQEALAEKCYVSFQQVQKYENGTNRISASRLTQMAAAMNCKVGDFFPDTENNQATQDPVGRAALELAQRFHGITALQALNALPEPLYRIVVEMIEKLNIANSAPVITISEVDPEQVAELMRKGGLRVDVVKPA